MRLIVGAGKHHRKQPNEITLDIRQFPGIDVVHDLNIRWPFGDGEFTHISSLHVVEHLQSLIHFMDEAHRVLKQGGSLYLETPCAGVDHDLEFCDPTHIRCYRPYTFQNYFTMEGIEAFGYTDKAWAILKIEVVNGCIHAHLTPLK